MRMTMKDTTPKKGLFTLENGQNLVFTFLLVSSLFLLWGLLNGMIDAMDKHFQDELGLSKSQSAWVQFAHYLGYFLMALPAGWLASKMGYKGGIIAGLLMVAVGGFWFVPATKINDWAQQQKIAAAQAHVEAAPDEEDAAAPKTPTPVKYYMGLRPATVAFIGYLFGICVIAAGLTFLETVANPYTTVLGPREYAATRINLAQSGNGIGWILGPILGGMFFYAKDASGQSMGSELLYLPYLYMAWIVLALAVIFFFAYIPDIKTKDDYQIDVADKDAAAATTVDRKLNHFQIYLFLFLNSAVLICVLGIFTWLLLSIFQKVGPALVSITTMLNPLKEHITVTPHNSLLWFLVEVACVLLAVAAIWMIFVSRKISHHSIWSHPHFSGAVLAQFLYVAAQAGIFSFFINYMTAEAPPLPKFLTVADSKSQILEKMENGEVNGFVGYFQKKSKDWFETNTAFHIDQVKDFPAFATRIKNAADPLSAYIKKDFEENFSSDLTHIDQLNNYDGEDARSLQSVMIQELNLLVRQDPRKALGGIALYNPKNFEGVTLSEETRNLLDQKLEEDKKVAEETNRLIEEEKNMTTEQKVAAAKERAKKAEKEGRVNAPLLNRLLLQEVYGNEFDYPRNILAVSEQSASMLLSIAFFCFFIGRFTGAWLLKKLSAHRTLGLYGIMNILMCYVIYAKLGWISVACVFLSFFFMSIMFPTIFALGIHGLGDRSKKASAFIVMAIMGGAVLPKLMGYVADQYDMSRGFVVPMVCFAFIAIYGFWWSKLSGSESLSGAKAS